MAFIHNFNGFEPAIGDNCFLAETATVIGQVELGSDCSVWYGAVLRGDAGLIRVGDRTNIQDGAVLHCSHGKSQTIVGCDVTIGHNAIVHGATIGNGALIGMGATVLDGAVVGSGAIVAAGALVLGGTKIEPGSLYAGVPARFMKPINADQAASLMRSSDTYIELKNVYLSSK
mgnify:CR=1 FL=1